MRLGVLIHAETAPPEAWVPLQDLLAERGEVSVVHAHADWSSPDVAGWWPVLRRHGMQLRQHFRSRASQEPAPVAMAVEAVQLALDSRVDALVLVGEVGSALPLVQWLRERGIEVVVAGPPATPLDVREACSEFLDLRDLESRVESRVAVTQPGRHRA